MSPEKSRWCHNVHHISAFTYEYIHLLFIGNILWFVIKQNAWIPSFCGVKERGILLPSGPYVVTPHLNTEAKTLQTLPYIIILKQLNKSGT